VTTFSDLGVPADLDHLLSTLGIVTPTPIQEATVPDAMSGRDVLGRGRTGSGKTLAFLLPVVTRLAKGERARRGAPRALVLAPTRELAAQINEVLRPLAASTGLTSQTVFGGVGQDPQVRAIARGVDILIACPGRLADLINQGHCSLGRIEIAVLDEADHMADLGFLPTVRKLLAMTPKNGQRLLFSATLDRAVDAVARQFLSDPATHDAEESQAPSADTAHHVLKIAREDRMNVLMDLTLTPGRTVVFTRTKHTAKNLTRKLNAAGSDAVELHGNLSQNARTRNLDAFHAGRVSTLVATDIAARGIHVDDVALVIHADPPADHKAYVHRSGRTARAGNTGTVVTLATPDQMGEVHRLTRAAGVQATVVNAIESLDLGEPVARTPRPAVVAPEHAPTGGGTARPPRARSARGQGGSRGQGPRGQGASRGQAASRGQGARGQAASRGQASRGGSGRGRPVEGTPSGRPSTHSAAGFSSGRRPAR
jgi:superfamily II DNA/RNA helicase